MDRLPASPLSICVALGKLIDLSEHSVSFNIRLIITFTSNGVGRITRGNPWKLLRMMSSMFTVSAQ